MPILTIEPGISEELHSSKFTYADDPIILGSTVRAQTATRSKRRTRRPRTRVHGHHSAAYWCCDCSRRPSSITVIMTLFDRVSLMSAVVMHRWRGVFRVQCGYTAERTRRCQPHLELIPAFYFEISTEHKPRSAHQVNSKQPVDSFPLTN